MAQRLTDMHIDRVSLVDKGANKREFAILKRAEDDGPLGKMDPTTWGNAIAKALHGVFFPGKPEPVAKATFASIIAAREISSELPDALYTLEDAIWSAVYAVDDNGADLSAAEKQALIAQNLDEFKAWVLELVDSGVSKRDEPVRKVGRKISAARLSRLQEAATNLTEVLAEVEAEDTATEKRAGEAQEDDMTPEQLQEAISKGVSMAMQPLIERVEKLEKGGSAAEPEQEVAKTDGEDELVEAVSKLADRIEALEKSRGARTAVEGQDGDVKKRGVFAGVF